MCVAGGGHVHLPSTLRSTVSFSTSNGPNLIRMPYSSSSPGVTFNRTKEATDFDKSPVHVMRPLYLAGAALASATPEGGTKTRVCTAEDGVNSQLIRLNFALSASVILYNHLKVKLDPTTAF